MNDELLRSYREPQSLGFLDGMLVRWQLDCRRTARVERVASVVLFLSLKANNP
jgi:hypothetical protein